MRSEVPPGRRPPSGDWSGYLADLLCDLYNESEYANPEGGLVLLAEEHWREVEALIQKAVDYFAKHVETWACEKVGERVYEGEELARIKKELCP